MTPDDSEQFQIAGFSDALTGETVEPSGPGSMTVEWDERGLFRVAGTSGEPGGQDATA